MAHSTLIDLNTSAPTVSATEDISRHLGLVYHIARAMTRKGCGMELDELVSAGTLGLIEAINNFDTSRGLAFATFATPRIRGAMLDELRRQDHVPRSVRRHSRAINQACDTLTSELGALPDATQLAERLGIDCATLWRWTNDSESAHMISLNSGWGSEEESATPEETTAAADAFDVDDVLTREQEIKALKHAIMALTQRERTVLALYYYEELRLSQIAKLLGVTESRVSQIRGHALAQLREHLASLRGAELSAERC